MKNKITKLGFALLFITGSAYAQNHTMSAKMRQATNEVALQQLAKKQAARFEQNYSKAVEIAREQGMPLTRITDEGTTSVLAGYDEVLDMLIYNKLYSTAGTENQAFFNNVAVGSSLQTANAKPLHADGIIGEDMLVGVWDGGAGLTNHLGFNNGRYQPKNNPNSSPAADARNRDHAAHTAGTVAANSFPGGEDAMGFAYGATVHAYQGLTGDLSTMIPAANAVSNPMIVSNHSYGLDFDPAKHNKSVFGKYTSASQAYDELANEAPYYTMVFAAGNDRRAGFNKSNGKDLLSQAGVSKNLVVVAATRGTEDFSGITGAGALGGSGVTPFIASYSNYGPTDDFRIKPDIAAKGGEQGVDPVVSIGDASITATEIMQGTSMAAPAVTGVFTLWQGYYHSLFNEYMRSASVRALMAHTARETGPFTGPDFMFGWGLIDAEKGREIIDQKEANTAIFEEVELGNTYRFDYEFDYDGNEPLVVTIAWNDPAAGPSAGLNDLNDQKLINDLDLRLVNTDDNKVYYPWSLIQKMSLSPTDNIAVRNVDNNRDNIEKIEPQNAGAGHYKVEVTHKGTLVDGPQNFTIIISGAGEDEMPSTDGSLGEEKFILDNINVYPNPVESILNIEGDLTTLSDATIQIFDISGKNIKDVAINFDANRNSIDVSSLQSGVYVLTISKGEVKQNYKFVKK